MNAIAYQLFQTGLGAAWIRPSPPARLHELGTWRGGALTWALLAYMRLAWKVVSSSRRQVFYMSPAVSGPAGMRDLLALLLAVCGRWRVVVHLHTGAVSGLFPAGLARLLRPAFGRTEVIVLLDQFVSPVENLGARSVSVLHNGVTCKSAAHMAGLSKTGEQLCALFLGNLLPSKGAPEVARAFGRVLDSGDSKWVIDFAGAHVAGGTMPLEALMQRAPDRVRLLGTVDIDQKCRLLSAAHMLLFPSAYPLEGSPLVLLEALEHGVVPVISDWAGLVATAGTTARIVTDADEMAAVMVHFGGLSIQERSVLAETCQRRWSAGWTAEAFAAGLQTIVGLAQPSLRPHRRWTSGA
jgi:glycosyltransferase involved in cell wall biosynthesis